MRGEAQRNCKAQRHKGERETNALGRAMGVYLGMIWGTAPRPKPDKKARQIGHRKRVAIAARKRRRLMAKESRRRNRG